MKPYAPDPTRRMSQAEAAKDCPLAVECDYAEIGACTLAKIYENCSLFKGKIKALQDKPNND